MKQTKAIAHILFLAMALCLPTQMAWANPQFDKALKHFKDFEINDTVKILTVLQGDASLSKEMQIKVALYLGMSYAYLRKKDLAKTSFAQAIKLSPNVRLPKGTPKRLQALFQESGGQSGAASPQATPPTRAEPPPTRVEPRIDPPPVRVEPRIDPPPTRAEPVAPPARRSMSFGGDPAPPQRGEPPARRSMSFGMGFTVRRRPAPRRAEPTFEPPPRRREAPGLTFEPPTRRASPSPTFEPPAARRSEPDPVVVDPPRKRPKQRVASMGGSTDPDAGGLFGDKKKKAKKGGNTGLWVAAWVTAIGAVLIAGGGAGFGAFAQSKRDQASKNAIQIDVPVAERDAGSFATIANVMFISAGAVGIGAVIFFVLATRKPKAPPATALHIPHRHPTHKNNPLPTQAATQLFSTSHP